MKLGLRPRYGLFAAGSAARSFLAAMPSLRKELGPVAASTVKVAGRIANQLQAGYLSRDLAAFNECEVILVCTPESGLERGVELLLAAPVEWNGKTVIFCASNVSSADFPAFVERGASVGSVNALEGLPKFFVTEGGREAMREIKRMVRDLHGRNLEIQAGRVRLFDAARTLSTSLFTPLVDGCVGWIQESGLQSKEAALVAEKLLLWTLRSYLHSGRRGWTGPAAKRDWASIERQYAAVKEVNALQAEYFLSGARHAFELYRSFPELARYLPKASALEPSLE